MIVKTNPKSVSNDDLRRMASEAEVAGDTEVAGEIRKALESGDEMALDDARQMYARRSCDAQYSLSVTQSLAWYK